MRKKQPTFVASIRCDIRDIEVIARYMSDQGVLMGTRSKVASRAMKVLADILRGDRPKGSVKEALSSLADMGYGETKNDKAKDILAKRIFNDECLSDALKQAIEYGQKQEK